MLEIISAFLGIFILDIERIVFAKVNLNKELVLKRFNFIIIFIISVLLELMCSFYMSGINKTIGIYIIYIVVFKILFNTRFLKSVFLTFFYAILLLVADLIGLFLLTNIFGIDRVVCFNEISGGLFSGITVFITFAFVSFLFRKPIKKIINAKIENNTKILFLSIVTLICILFFLYVFGNEFKLYRNSLPYLISLLVLLTVLFVLIRQTFINNKLMKEYDKLLEFMTTYENEIEKQRILRHETKNEFLTIKAKLCDKQKNREIVAYIDEILKDKIIVNQEKYAKFGYLPANGIKGLCYFKVQEAENLGIDVSINVSSKMKKSSIYNLNIKNQRDLGKMLGVFLDNAIEASLVSKKKQLGIEIYVNNKKETVVIISNTFNNDINKTIIGKERFTTKGKNRGHGLLLVKYIINDAKLFDIKTDVVKDLYIQTLIIKKTNEE